MGCMPRENRHVSFWKPSPVQAARPFSACRAKHSTASISVSGAASWRLVAPHGCKGQAWLGVWTRPRQPCTPPGLSRAWLMRTHAADDAG